MIRLLLDTSAYSAWKRGHRVLAEGLAAADVLALSATVVGELRAGFQRGNRRASNEAELASLFQHSGVEFLAVGDETSRRYALVVDALRRAGTPVPANDAWIAASAAEHGLEIWTCDSDFARIPGVSVRMFEPGA